MTEAALDSKMTPEAREWGGKALRGAEAGTVVACGVWENAASNHDTVWIRERGGGVRSYPMRTGHASALSHGIDQAIRKARK